MMKFSIQYKLFATMLVATLSVVVFMTLIIRWSFDKGFLEYVNIEEQEEITRLAHQLEGYYATHKSWEDLRQQPWEILQLHASIMPPGKAKHRLNEMSEEHHYREWMQKIKSDRKDDFRHPIERTVILDENGKIFFGEKLQTKLPRLQPLMYNGKQVGNIGLYMPRKLFEANELLFVEKQTTFLFMACCISIVIAVGVTLLLAYFLAKPVRRLSYAARRLAEGDFSVRVPAESNSEMDRLASDFNTLASALENKKKQLERWVADIAHELRTPLTSLKGQIEALQDGIRTPDEKTYDILHKGVTRLERLVNDLYDLNRSDLGTFNLQTKKIDLCKLVKTEIMVHQQEAATAGLKLSAQCQDRPVSILADTQRIQQLLGNLITNSIRYTDRGGSIALRVHNDAEQAILEIEDTAPGVPDEALPNLFDRLYRVEQSRNRALGGSGLGLAICQQIVFAHHGTISASQAAAGGLKMTVTIPLITE